MKKTQKISSPQSSNFDFKNLESQLEAVFTKSLPALPTKAVDFLVMISPYLAILGVVAGIPAITALLGLGRVMSVYRLTGVSLGFTYQLANVLMIVQMILMGLSVQGLFARKLSAWRLMYYSAWISAVAGLFSGGIVTMLIGGAISFYLLFQVKKAYK